MAKDKLSLDELFKQKLQGLEGATPPGNWGDVEQLLDRKEKRRKRGYFFLAALALISLGILSTVVLQKDSSEKKKSAEKTVQPENSASPNGNKLMHTTIPEEKVDQKIETRDSATQLNLISEKEKKQFRDTKQMVIRNEQDDSQVNGNSRDIDKKEIRRSLNLSISNEKANLNLQEKQNVAENKRPDEELPKFEQTNTHTNKSEITSPEGMKNDEMVLIHSLPFVLELNRTQAELIQSGALLTDTFKQKSGRHFSCDLQAGITYGFHTSSLQPLFGIGFNYQLNSSIRIALAVQYANEGKLELTDSSMQVNYFLTKESKQETIVLHKLNCLSIPFTVRYEFLHGHELEAGAGLSFVLNSKGDFREVQSIGAADAIHENNNVSGYLDGIEQTNYFLTAGYQMQFSPRLFVHAGYRYGLSSLIQKDVFREEDQLFSTSLSLSIKYKIY